MTTLYKVLAADGSPFLGGAGRWDLPVRNPGGTWTPGAWRQVEGPLVMCENGLHLATIDHLPRWVGPRIWVAEADGEVVEEDDKVVARRARLVAGTAWDERAARHFAADCAEHVLHLAEPEWRLTLEVVLHTVRAHADGEATDEELKAARAAAKAATAVSTAWAAAWATVWAAAEARAAVWDAAMAAVRAVEWTAVEAGTWQAAGDAERAWQAERLRAYLEGIA